MGKKTFIAGLIITAFLISLVVGMQAGEVAKANPFMFYHKVSPIPGSSPSQITIISPQNNTVYNSITIITFNLSSPTTTVGSYGTYYTAVTLDNNTALYSNNGGSLPQPFSFSPSPIVSFSEGKHNITVYSQAIFFPEEKTYFYLDNSSTVYFTIDTTPPSISNLSVMNKTYNSNMIPLNFNINKTVSWSAYNLDNNSNLILAGNTTLTGLSNGSHSIMVYAVDAVGNKGKSSVVYFTVDTSTPSPSPSPSTSSSPTESTTQQPTIESSQTPDRPKIGDFAPVLIPASMILIAIIAVGLLIYFRRRKE